MTPKEQGQVVAVNRLFLANYLNMQKEHGVHVTGNAFLLMVENLLVAFPDVYFQLTSRVTQRLLDANQKMISDVKINLPKKKGGKSMGTKKKPKPKPKC